MGAASAAVAAVSKAAIDSYANYEQLVGGVETLFGDSADVVKGYAEEAFSTVGMSCNAYMETVTGFAASLVSSLGGDTATAAQKANTAVADMADNANKMGTDMQSIQNAYQGFAKQNYTMLDNLKLGYGGTKEEMERLLEEAEKFRKPNSALMLIMMFPAFRILLTLFTLCRLKWAFQVLPQSRQRKLLQAGL